MTSAHEFLAHASSWLWPIVVQHLWQATLFAAVVCFFCFFGKRASSKTRYAVWLLASSKFLLPSVFFAWIAAQLDIHIPWPTQPLSASSVRVVMEFPLARESEGQTVVLSEVEADSPKTETAHTELYCGLTLVWALGCVSLQTSWWRRRFTMRAKLREGEPVLSGTALESLHRAKSLLQERRPVTLLLSSEFPEPGVCGIRKPQLVLPKGVVEALTHQELEAIFLHEVAHVRRRDNLAGMFQSWLCCLFWFYPVIWLIDRQLLVERERACDEEVLSHMPNCQEYLSSLLKVFRSSLGEKVSGASLITGSHLKRRIDNMRSHRSRKNSVAWHRLMITVFVVGWIISAVAAVPRNQKVLVAQQRPSNTTGRAEELLSTSKSITGGVHGGVTENIENGVAGEIAGRVKGEAPRAPGRKAKDPAEPPLALAMNQTVASPAQQAGSAKLFGTVYDASQARVPDATVVISSQEGGIKEITISGAVGEYEFRALPLGRYSVEVRSLGFHPLRQALELHANEPRKLDVILEVGGVNETVNVVAKAPPTASPDTRSGPPQRIRVGGNVQATKLVHQVKPVYPERAQAQGIQGTVLLEAIILKDGSLGALRVLNKLTDPELVDAAIEAVKNWRYEPTLLNGQPIEVVTTITVNFRLS